MPLDGIVIIPITVGIEFVELQVVGTGRLHVVNRERVGAAGIDIDGFLRDIVPISICRVVIHLDKNSGIGNEVARYQVVECSLDCDARLQVASDRVGAGREGNEDRIALASVAIGIGRVPLVMIEVVILQPVAIAVVACVYVGEVQVIVAC